jgi:uncharacterized protein YoxC
VDRILQAETSMSEEPTTGKRDLEMEANGALSELKDLIILLDMAGDYLCAETFLQKMASVIEENCRVLKDWAKELRKRFVGKPLHEIDIEEPFDGLAAFSKDLMEAEGNLDDPCRKGTVARQLDEKIRFLKKRLAELKDRVEGEAAPYTARDSAGRLLGKLKFIFRGFVTTYKVASRIIFFVVMICVFSFVTLFITMEKEDKVLEEIHHTKDLIRSKEAQLAGINSEIEKIRSKTSKMESSIVSRDEKISILELNLTSHKLADSKEKIRADLDRNRKMLDEKTRKLNRMKRKSFLARLLRM